MHNWDKKPPTTNFSIDSILSKPEVPKDQKNTNEKLLPRLNKVFDNPCPWTSKSPILYSPKSHLTPYQQINYFNFYAPQNHYQNYYENILQINQNFFTYPSSSEPQAKSSPIIGSPAQKTTTPNFNVYDYNFLKISDSNNADCKTNETKISNQILELNRVIESDTKSGLLSGTQFECKICLKVFDNDLALSVSFMWFFPLK